MLSFNASVFMMSRTLPYFFSSCEFVCLYQYGLAEWGVSTPTASPVPHPGFTSLRTPIIPVLNSHWVYLRYLHICFFGSLGRNFLFLGGTAPPPTVYAYEMAVASRWIEPSVFIPFPGILIIYPRGSSASSLFFASMNTEELRRHPPV